MRLMGVTTSQFFFGFHWFAGVAIARHGIEIVGTNVFHARGKKSRVKLCTVTTKFFRSVLIPVQRVNCNVNALIHRCSRYPVNDSFFFFHS